MAMEPVWTLYVCVIVVGWESTVLFVDALMDVGPTSTAMMDCVLVIPDSLE